MKHAFTLLVLLLGCCVPAVFAAPGTSEATITSDELVLRNNGDLAIFSGHVVLTQDTYQIRSKRMVRTKATGLVDAQGQVVGTWVSDKGEKVTVKGDLARYHADTETVDMWGKSRVHVQVDGEKDKATFHGDRGWMLTQKPGKAKLIGNVTGHIIPGGGH